MTVRPENAASEKTSVPSAARFGGRACGRVTSSGWPKPGSRSLTTKMSAKSAASSRPSSISTRRWLRFWTTIRSSMQSPTKRSRSMTSSFGWRPPASGFRSTNEARCGVECSYDSGSSRAPPSVSTERERKRVSEAKKPDAVARPSTSPRSSQTQKVDPSRTVSGKALRGWSDCAAALLVEEQHLLEWHGERLLLPGLQARLDRKLDHDLVVAEPEMAKLFVAQVLDHLDCG